MLYLIKAIEAKYQATAALREGVSGGFHWGYIPQKEKSRPAVVGNIISAPTELDTSDTVLQFPSLQISVFGRTLPAVLAVAERWKSGLHKASLTFDTGRLLKIHFANETPIAPFPDEQEELLSAWNHVLEFDLTTQQEI